MTTQGDPYMDLRRRVQRRMEARLRLTEGEVSRERTLRQIEAALGLPRGRADDREALTDALQETFTEAMVAERVRLSAYESQRLFTLILGDLVGMGPLDSLLEDSGVSAAYVLGSRAIDVERGGRLVRGEARFDDEAHLNKIARRIFTPMGYWVGEGTGLATGHVPDGGRVDAVLGPDIAPDGVQMVVRRQTASPPSLAALVEAEWMPGEVADFIHASLLARRNILVAGPPRSGKTTLLAALAGSLPDEARLVVVERGLEMTLARSNLVRLEARPQDGASYTAEAVLRHAAAMQPDWVWLGEVTADVAAIYVDMLPRVGLCTTLAVRAPGGPPGMRSNPRHALDRLTALVLGSNPGLPDDLVERQVAAGLDLVVQVGRGQTDTPLVVEIAWVLHQGTDWRLESVYRASEGPGEAMKQATQDLTAIASRLSGWRTAPAGGHAALPQPVINPDGTLSDPTLDDLYILGGGQMIGLRESEGEPFSEDLADPEGEIRRLTQSGDPATLLWSEIRADGVRVALARPPVAFKGTSASVERFAAQPGGLKRLADLGLVTADSGSLVVNAARAGRSILTCGPAGSGKRAFMGSLLRVLRDASEWQVIESLDANSLPALLASEGQNKVMAAVHCGDSVQPLTALDAWYSLSSGEEKPETALKLAAIFALLVRMGRVGGRQRMILAVEEIIAQSDGYQLRPLFTAQTDENRRLRLAQVAQPSF